MITAEILARSLDKFQCQYADRHMKYAMRQRTKASNLRIHSYFDNVMTKFMINNRTGAWKTDVNLSILLEAVSNITHIPLERRTQFAVRYFRC